LIGITVENRGPEAAALHLLPQLWFRNTWVRGRHPDEPRPSLAAEGGAVVARHALLGDMRLCCDGDPELLFCDNETNGPRLFGIPAAAAAGPFKDGIHDFVVHGARGAVNPGRTGTKMAACYRLEIPAGGSATARPRLAAQPPRDPFAHFTAVFAARLREADEFYAELAAPGPALGEEAMWVARQAYAGLLWGKQFYHYDVSHWLEGDPA